MEDTTEEQIIMELVVNGGDARSRAIEAIWLAKAGDFPGARNKLADCSEALNKAHKFQTEILQAESGGKKVGVSLLMVHGQDHLMNAITVRDLAIEFVDMYEKFSEN